MIAKRVRKSAVGRAGIIFFFEIIFLMSLSVGAVSASSELTDKQNHDDKDDKKVKASYSTAYEVVSDLKRQGVKIDPTMLKKGVDDALKGSQPLLPPRQMREVLMSLQKQITEESEKKAKEEAARNLEEGKTFLKENRKREGVKELPDGLQYRVIREGSGVTPKAGDIVTVQYRGTLIDGTEFDSSFKRGKPATFRADRVIEGWKEALQMMKKGARWQLFVPPGLAYGERRNGPVAPNSTLIFEIELLSVDSSVKPGSEVRQSQDADQEKENVSADKNSRRKGGVDGKLQGNGKLSGAPEE